MNKCLILFALLGLQAQAQSLALSDYLEQVKSKNSQAQALKKNIEAYKNRVEEGEQLTTPQLFGEYNLVDDKKETMMVNMQGDRTKAMSWKAGLKQQTPFGLLASAYLTTQRTNIHGVSSVFVPQNDWAESAAVLELRQSLWKNSFGAATRGDRDAINAGNRLQWMQNRFALKNLLQEAETTYWTLASLNQIVKLQQGNVERAKKLRDLMSSRLKMKLVDDVDAMQAQASLETRELELKASMDERAAAMRAFQTLRGLDSDSTEELQDLPIQEWLAKPKALPNNPRREDFEMKRAQSLVTEAKAKAGKSKVQPELDVYAKFAANGRDASITESYKEVNVGEHPGWMVGVSVSVPLDLLLYSDLNASYRQERQAAQDMMAQANFEEERTWKDSIRRSADAQARFESALNLEKLQEKIVTRERQRLMNGRTTTFQLITQEQTLAAAQIQRVKNQLDFVRTSNGLKTFQESL